MVVSWLFRGCCVVVWWLFGGCLVVVWCFFCGCLVVVWWLFGGCFVVVLWLFHGCFVVVSWLSVDFFVWLSCLVVWLFCFAADSLFCGGANQPAGAPSHSNERGHTRNTFCCLCRFHHTQRRPDTGFWCFLHRH